MQYLLIWIPKNFQKLLAAGLTAGFLFPTLLAPVAVLSDAMVAAIIFTSFLTRPTATSPLTSDFKKISINILLMKLAFPVLIYAATRFFDPAIGIALVLLSALPAAGVSPSLIRLLGGQSELALKILFLESLASCLTVPLLFSWLFSSEDAVTPQAMMQYFSMVLLLPLALASLLRKAIKNGDLPAVTAWGSLMSVLLIVTLVASIAGKIGPSLLANPSYSVLLVLIACAAVPVFALTSVIANRAKNKESAITFSIKNMYINIGLGLGVATSYFSPEVALILLAYVIPANLLPRFIAAAAGRLVGARG